MTLVRTNITIPEEVLAYVDEVAGPRGRSAWISDLVAREVKRERARRILRETAGVFKDHSPWGSTHEEVDSTLRELRDSWDRDDRIWPEGRDRDGIPD